MSAETTPEEVTAEPLSYLIATHTNLIGVSIDEDLSEMMVRHIAGGARYYGIAEFDDGEIWVVKNTRETEDITQIVNLRTDEVLQFETVLKDVHQMTRAYGSRRGLYLTNTYYNSVVWKDLESGEEHIYTIGGEFEHDYAHPNSIWHDPPYVWVMLHNKLFRRSEICRLTHDPSSGFDVGYRRETRFCLPHGACHNLRFDRACMTYLASEQEAAVQINHLTGNVLRQFPIASGYIKGMARIDDVRMLVGMNPNVPAKERYESDVELGVVDTRDGGLRSGFPLRLAEGEPAGNINEIRRIRSL